MTSARVVIMAGGTGGHIFPALAVADVLRERGHTVTWIGTRQGLEAKLVPTANIPIEWIEISGLRGKGFMALLKAPFRLLRALLQAMRILRRVKPAAVLGMGGFASGPGGIAARLCGYPLVLHEQNAVPGMTNRMLSHVAVRVMEGFPGSFSASRHAEYVGNPVRAAIAELPAPTERFAEREGAPRLLILGGSQGARVLNETVPLAVAALDPDLRPEVWHQTGARDIDSVKAAYCEHGIHGKIVPFIDDMAEAYGWADLAVCRAGALTIAELTASGLGAVLVPFAAAVDDHQTQNAMLMTRSGAAERLAQDKLAPDTLAAMLKRLLGDRPRLLSMAMRARTLARVDAAERVADACLQQGGVA